jgi:hypothetical protein
LAVAQEYAGRLALVAFITSAVQGLLGGSSFEPALKYALAAAGVCYVLGWLCGELARRLVAESVQAEFDSDTAAKSAATPAEVAPSR